MRVFLPGSKFVGSEMICVRFREVNKSSSSLPSGFVSPSGHHCSECPLKSPVKYIRKGFSALILECKFLKYSKKALNSEVECLKAGLRYNTVKNIFLRSNFSSSTRDSSKDKSLLGVTGREF